MADRDTKRTWLEVMPPGAPMPTVLSHDELLAALKDRGVDLPAATLANWRRWGLVPRPIRRRYQGVTQAVYPVWYVDGLQRIREMREAGLSLENIQAVFVDEWPALAMNWKDPMNPLFATLLYEVSRANGVPTGVTQVTISFQDAEGNEVSTRTMPYRSSRD